MLVRVVSLATLVVTISATLVCTSTWPSIPSSWCNSNCNHVVPYCPYFCQCNDGGPHVTPLTCHALTVTVTDSWCDQNCNHVPQYCPASVCRCDSTAISASRSASQTRSATRSKSATQSTSFTSSRSATPSHSPTPSTSPSTPSSSSPSPSTTPSISTSGSSSATTSLTPTTSTTSSTSATASVSPTTSPSASASVSPSAVSQTFRVFMGDSNGDGWQGIEMTVKNCAGTVEGGPFSLSLGFGGNDYFSSTNTQGFLVSVGNGATADEIRWSIYDGVDTLVASGLAPLTDSPYFCPEVCDTNNGGCTAQQQCSSYFGAVTCT